MVVATAQFKGCDGLRDPQGQESQGYGHSDACRIVGINRRTGKQWRHGHHSPTYGKPKPPIMAEAPAAGLSRYLREVRGLEPAVK
ncbi:hypothetical protein ACFUVZ_48330 [Streptomyces chartreusis]|uniref:hypothetical protein n=1 Tax=Streptomyces chartreusis TaxID=1969 RepID=UPI00363578C6